MSVIIKAYRTFVRQEGKTMETRFVIQTVIEIIIAAVLLYGFFVEDKWVAFEEKLFKGIKKILKGKAQKRRAEIIPFENYELKRTCR